MRKLILQTGLSLGDVVMLTAAVRDLHRCYPGQFVTDVRTTCGEVWDNNPYLTPLDPHDPEVETIHCDYPLIHWSNQVPYHFVHGFIDHLNAQLRVEVKATEFRGDIHLSRRERTGKGALVERVGVDLPYWLVLAGGKHDVTIKWWDSERYQQVVDRFRGRIQFVQLGQAGHYHPALKGAIDLRGRTTVRELIRLVHGCQGILCGVTGLMHLAAAVPVRAANPGLRPCVVVAGGREPAHWEAYPGHEFLHTIGQLPCCASGGCWRSRTVPLGDGDARDRKANRCVDVVGRLPHCMHLISVDDVADRIERFFEGGRLRFLTPGQQRRGARAAETSAGNPFELERITPGNVRPSLERMIERIRPYSGPTQGRGIVICAGGPRLFTCAWVNIRMLRWLGCRFPIELWYLGPREMSAEMIRLLRPYGVRCVDALARPGTEKSRPLGGWELKPFAIVHSSFREVLFLDADNVAVRNPEFLFNTAEYREHGALFWPDNPGTEVKPVAVRLCGLTQIGDRPFETGQMLLDKARCWEALQTTLWLNEHSDFFYPLTWGDKETFRLGFHKVKKSYAMPAKSPQGRMRQYDFRGRLLFQHRNTDKWSLDLTPRRISGFRYQAECCGFLEELRARWQPPSAHPPRFRAEEVPTTSPEITQRERTRKTSSLPPRARRAMPRPEPLTIVTLFDSAMACVGRRTSRAWQSYAIHNGYGFVCFEHSLDRARPTPWSKILAVLRVMEERHTNVLWVDADTLPLNLAFQVDQLLTPGRELVFASDFNGLNSGVFLARDSTWTRRFLETVYFLGDVRKNPDPFGDKWEQNTIKAVLEAFRVEAHKVQVCLPRVLNSSVSSYERGDFLIHFGALSNRDRLKYLDEFQAQRPALS